MRFAFSLFLSFFFFFVFFFWIKSTYICIWQVVTFKNIITFWPDHMDYIDIKRRRANFQIQEHWIPMIKIIKLSPYDFINGLQFNYQNKILVTMEIWHPLCNINEIDDPGYKLYRNPHDWEGPKKQKKKVPISKWISSIPANKTLTKPNNKKYII